VLVAKVSYVKYVGCINPTFSIGLLHIDTGKLREPAPQTTHIYIINVTVLYDELNIIIVLYVTT